MAFWTSVAFLTGACIALQKERSRQTRLIRSILVHAPAPTVFEVLGNIENIPEWYRFPGRAAASLLTRLSRWGEHIPGEWRLDTRGGRHGNEIQIRWIQNKEFVYSSHDPRGVTYDCIFRIAAKDRDSMLVWELRYRNPRWIDAALNRAVVVKNISSSMHRSLETIRRLAENRAAAQRSLKQAELFWPVRRSKAS